MSDSKVCDHFGRTLGVLVNQDCDKESRLKSTALTEVRQTAKDHREAIQELRRNPARGFEKLEAIRPVRGLAGL